MLKTEVNNKLDIMEFRIADIFTDSLVRLKNDEQKAVKTTAFDLQMNPANPGYQFHKLDRARDQNFWSLRVSRDIRMIVHRTTYSLLLCYVAHHDDAYQWAERRKLEVHPRTGAMQLVELHETIEEKIIPRYIEQQPTKPLLFTHISEEELLSYGVPAEWMTAVRGANEDTILDIADHLPREAAESLLDLAVGIKPLIPAAAEIGVNPFDHPDAQRRFRVMSNIEELERALEFPWDKWAVFLHPAQRQLVEKDYNGPVRISGSAGTGKTIVALHRAVYLAKNNPNARVLLTTFSDALASALRIKIRRLIFNEPRVSERLEVHSIGSIGKRLYSLNLGAPQIASEEMVKQLISEASSRTAEHKFSLHFLASEWDQVVDAWQLQSWEDYRDVRRLGRKTRLSEEKRAVLWSIFEQVMARLRARDLLTESQLFTQLANHLSHPDHRPYDHVIVDEAQDISVSQLRFLAALGAGRVNGIFFTGDLGQRIFQQPFSWKALGIEIRGRSATLKINYRTSHQIRSQADKLLAPEISDVDGNIESRRGTISVFNGPKPTISVFNTQTEENMAVANWINNLKQDGVKPEEMGIFVRSYKELDRATKVCSLSNMPFQILDSTIETIRGKVTISTMHLAKGLEFRAVVVMACDDEVIPSMERIEQVAEDTDLDEVYNTERHLLYVACTRARDYLLVTGTLPASEFIDDLVNNL